MKQRIITALVLAPIAIGAIIFLPLKFFMLAAAAVFLLASREWAGFVDKKPSSFILYFFGAVLGLTIAMLPIESTWQATGVNPTLLYFIIAGVVWWVVASLMVFSYPKSAKWWSKSKGLKSIFGLLTLVPFFWGMVVLRSVDIYHDFYYGAELLLHVCLLVWAADTGAYFFGKRFGKNKLAPNVSPGKTIEGFAGGVAVAMVVALCSSLMLSIPDDKVVMFFVGSLAAILVSALGDLTESIFKRESGLKDSSNLLPGHGGILDRIDSLTAAVPVFALFYLLSL